jgi:hypothetical protein
MMSRLLGLTLSGAILLMHPAGSDARPTKAPARTNSQTCSLSVADQIRNRQLDWPAFDLAGEIPKTAMWFSAKRCYREAVLVGADYLARAPHLGVREKAAVMFHMARNLARAGDKSGAALLAAASRRSDQEPNARLDWNTYVQGFYGYLSGDRALLVEAHKKLVGAGGEGNLMNARVLERAKRCFGQPFLIVETAARCAPAEMPSRHRTSSVFSTFRSGDRRKSPFL